MKQVQLSICCFFLLGLFTFSISIGVSSSKLPTKRLLKGGGGGGDEEGEAPSDSSPGGNYNETMHLKSGIESILIIGIVITSIVCLLIILLIIFNICMKCCAKEKADDQGETVMENKYEEV